MKKFCLNIALCVATLFAFSCCLYADELTVANTTSYNNTYVPIYGNYVDAKFRSQIVYPISDLTEMSSMIGNNITAISFYLKATSTFNASFYVRLGEISGTGFDSKVWFTDELTEVYSGVITPSSTLVTITFTTPYLYSGGNLLVDIQTKEVGTYNKSTYYGSTMLTTKKASAYAYNGSVTAPYSTEWFLPKTTFTYEPAGAITCPKPSDLTRTALSATSASFSWTAGGDETQWQYVCLPAATALDWSDARVETATSASATVSGLSAQTSYKFYVRAYCAADDQSKEISIDFTTPCAGESVPWDEDFEGMTIGNSGSAAPACWDRLNTNEGAYPYAYVNNSTGYYKDTRALYFQSSASKYSYMILPPFDAATNTLQVSFWYRTENTDATSGQFSIGYMTDVTDASTFTAVGGPYARTTTITQIEEVSFPAAPAGSRIAFRLGGGTSNNYYASLDDINVSIASSCTKPSDLTAVATSATTASVTWQKNGTETAWDLQYSSDGGSTWTTLNLTTSNVAVDGTDCTYSLTGLSAVTTYKVRVRANCGGGSESSYMSDVSFETPCAAITALPWSEDCESAATNSIISCWDNSGSASATLATDPAYIWGVYSYGGNQMMRFNNFNVKAGTALINSPSITLPAFPTYKLYFDYAHRATCGAFDVKVSTNGGVSFTTIDSYTKGATNDQYDPGTFTTTSIDLSDYAGQTIIIQFFATANYDYGAIFIDNLSIESSLDCSAPQNVAVSAVTGTTAHVAWDALDGISTYQYCVVAHGAAADWSGNLTVNVTSVDLTSLTSGTEVDFYVRGKCSESIWSTPSNVVSFTPTCPTPSGVSFSNRTYNSARVTWTAGGGETGWNLRYKAGTGSWSSPVHVATNAYDLTGLTTDVTYTVEVQADCGGTWASNTYTPVCATPTTAAISGISDVNATATWSAAVGSGITTFQYIVVARDATPDWSASTTVNATSALLAGLTEDTDYDFYVRSKCAEGNFSESLKRQFSTATSGTLNFYDDGNLVYSVSVVEGEVIPLASYRAIIEATGHEFSACDGYTFYGWRKDAPLAEETEVAGTISSVTIGSEDVNLFAVYSKTENYYTKLLNNKPISASAPTNCVIVGEYGGEYYALSNENVSMAADGGTTSNPWVGITSEHVTYRDGHLFDVPDQCIWQAKYVTADAQWQIKNSQSSKYLYLYAYLSGSTFKYFKSACSDNNDQGPKTLTINATTGAATFEKSQTKYGTIGLYFAHTVAAGKIGVSAYSDMFMVCGNSSTALTDYTTFNQGTIYIFTPSSETVYRSRCSDYTVRFRACGSGVCTSATITNPVRTEVGGNGVMLPTISNVHVACPSIWEFVGWKETPVPNETYEEPDMLDPDVAYVPSVNNMDIYAVYRHKTDGELDYWSSYPLCDPFTVFFYPGTGQIAGENAVYPATEPTAGAGVTLPAASYDCFGWNMAGWKKTPVEETAVMPEGLMDVGSVYTPSVEDEQLYAVYRKGTSAYWTTYPICDRCTIAVNAGTGFVAGQSIKLYYEGLINGGITLPTATFESDDCDVWTFCGWTRNQLTGGTTIEPELRLSGTRYHSHSDDIDSLYAVYRRTTGGTTIWTSLPDCEPYNVTLHANGMNSAEAVSFDGEPSKVVYEPSIGSGLTFNAAMQPAIECPDRWSFVGWQHGSPVERRYSVPDGLFYNGDTYYITGTDESFYAVYCHKTAGVADYWTSNPDCELYTVKIHSCEGVLPGGESEDILTEERAGAGVTLPTPIPLCDTRGWSFRGWVIGGELSTTTDLGGLTLYPAGTFVPMRNNLELYAVYSIEAFKQISNVLDLTSTDKYVIAVFHDYEGDYTHNNFALSNSAHATQTRYLNLEPIDAYYDEYGAKYVTNAPVSCQWKLEESSGSYKIKNVATSKYLQYEAYYHDDSEDALYSSSSKFYVNANATSAEVYYHWQINVTGGYVWSYKQSFSGTRMSFDLADVDMTSFYSYMGSDAASSKLYKYVGTMYSSWPHCLEYTVYFDGCDGMSSVLSQTEASAGLGVTLPTVTDVCEGWEFAGWATEPLYESVTIPTVNVLPAGSNYVPERNNTTLYAVYYQPTTTYQRVNDLDELYLGGNYVYTYYYPYTGENFAVSNALNSGWGIRPVAVSITSNTITDPDESLIWNMRGTAEYFSLYNYAANNYVDLTGAQGSYAKLSTKSVDNIEIDESDANLFYLKSRIAGYYMTGSNMNFGIGNTAYNFSIFRQKVNGYWSYPCSELVEPMRWGDGEVYVESLTYDGAPTSGSLYIESIEVDSFGTYRITHTAKRGSRIRIKWGSKHYIMTVPYIATPTSVPSIGNEPERNLAIMSGAEFVVDKDVRLNSLYVYEGGQLIVESGSLTVDTLILRTEGDMTAPSVIINGTASVNITSGVMYHDRRIEDDRYYFFTLPFNSVLGSLRYTGLISATSLPVPTYYTDYYLKYYDGTSRATDARTGSLKSTYWTHILPKSTAVLASVFELQAGKGYIVGITDKADEHKKRTLRFRMNVESDWTDFEDGTDDKVIDVEPSKADVTANDNHAGWNFIGNPYLHNYYSGPADGGSGLKTGHYVKNAGQWVIASDRTQTIPYLTYYNPDIDDYYQTRADNAAIRPFSAVFVQIEDNNQLMFANPIETSLAPADAPAYRRSQQAESEKAVYTGFTILAEDHDILAGYGFDNVGLVISDKYTTDYEIGADLLKMSSTKQLHAYAIAGDNQLAFAAVNKSVAANSVPVGVSIPENGFYTFVFDEEMYDFEDVERLLLTDHQEGITVDLILEDYEFYIEKGVNNSRFAVSAVVHEQKGTTTEVEKTDGIAPFCYTTNKGITISNLSAGTDVYVYDMTGKLAVAKHDVEGRVSFSLQSGVYTIVLSSADSSRTLRSVVR